MKKINKIWVLTLLLLIPLISAWQDDQRCDISSDCPIIIYAVNRTDASMVYVNAVCNITLNHMNGSGTLIDAALMTNWSDGSHNYTLNTAYVDTYRYFVLCNQSGNYGRETGMIIVGDIPRITTAQNETLMNLVSLHAGIGANTTYLNTSLSNRFGKVESDTVAFNESTHKELQHATHGLNAIYTYLSNTIKDLLTGIVDDESANFTKLEDYDGRFDAVDGNITAINKSISEHGDIAWTGAALTSIQNVTLMSLSEGMTTNTSYLNTSLSNRFSQIESDISDMNISVGKELQHATHGLKAIYDYLVNTIKALLDGIIDDESANFTKIDTSLNELRGRFNATDGNFSEVDTELNNVDIYIDELRGRFNATDSNLSEIDTELTNVDTELTNVDTELACIVKGMGENTTYLNDSAVNRFDLVDTELRSVVKGMGENTTYINDSLTDRFDLVDNNISILMGIVGDGRFDAIDGNLTEIDQSLGCVISGMGTNTTYLNASLTGRFSYLDAAFSGMSSDMSQNFTNISVRFDTLDNRTDESDKFIRRVWNTLTNNSLVDDVWSRTARTLTALNWSILSNWEWFTSLSVPNATLTYIYDADNYLANMTYNYTELGISRQELYYYDNASYLDNVSIQSIEGAS